MTATRLAKAATLVVLASGWVVAGWFLWQTTVPDDLDPSHVDPHRYWSAHALHRAQHFDDFLRWEWAIATLVQLAALAGLAWLGPRLARPGGAGRGAARGGVGGGSNLRP